MRPDVQDLGFVPGDFLDPDDDGYYDDMTSHGPLRGFAYALLPSLALWALIAALIGWAWYG